MKTVDGKEIRLDRLGKYDKFSGLDGKVLNFLKRSEASAQEFASLASMDSHQISSAIMTETWRTSGLRRDLGNATAYGKDWSIVKAVWQKTMFPETTYYPTDKLVDLYLSEAFRAGKRVATTDNPFMNYMEDSGMSKAKIRLLKRLYGLSRKEGLDEKLIKSPAYQEFKKQFDVEAMGKTLESIEEHYKNVFFKMFWDDSRKARFAQALNENKEIAGRNIEISDNILLFFLHCFLS